MGKLVLANAALSVLRVCGNSVYLNATGICREDGERFVFLPIPLFIEPQVWGLFVECHEGSSRSAGDEFTYSQMIAYSPTAREVRIETQSGTKLVQIEKADVDFSPFEKTQTDGPFLFDVFERDGCEGLVIARANAALPDVFCKVFGPAEQSVCEQFIERKRNKWASPARKKAAEPSEHADPASLSNAQPDRPILR